MHQRGGVAATAVQHVDAAVLFVEAEDVRRQRVFGRDFEHWLPRLAAQLEDLEAAIRRRFGRQPNREVVVDQDGREAVVLGQQAALAGGQVDPVQVVPFRVAVVHADDHHAGRALALRDHLRLHALVGREVDDFTARQVDAVQVPVLVAAFVAGVEDVLAIEGPEVRGNAAIGVVGDRPHAAEVAAVTHPNIHDAVQRRAEAHLRPVRAQPPLEAHGIAEQHTAVDQRRRFDRRCLGRGGVGCRGLRGGCFGRGPRFASGQAQEHKQGQH